MGMSRCGLHEDIYGAIMQGDTDIRADLYRNIVLAGGSTMFDGMKERLEKELTALAPTAFTVEVIALPERKNLSRKCRR